MLGYWSDQFWWAGRERVLSPRQVKKLYARHSEPGLLIILPEIVQSLFVCFFATMILLIFSCHQLTTPSATYLSLRRQKLVHGDKSSKKPSYSLWAGLFTKTNNKCFFWHVSCHSISKILKYKCFRFLFHFSVGLVCGAHSIVSLVSSLDQISPFVI